MTFDKTHIEFRGLNYLESYLNKRRWQRLGFLDDIDEVSRSNIAFLYESEASYLIDYDNKEKE